MLLSMVGPVRRRVRPRRSGPPDTAIRSTLASNATAVST